jgi:hypothetical protein
LGVDAQKWNSVKPLHYFAPRLEMQLVTSQKVLIKDEKYLDNINFVC